MSINEIILARKKTERLKIYLYLQLLWEIAFLVSKPYTKIKLLVTFRV